MFMPFTRGRCRRALAPALALLLGCATSPSHGALTIGATRVVFDGAQRNTTVMVRNPSSQVYAAQVWINTEADDTTTPVPFMPSPGLFRLDPDKEQLVRINGLPNNLPQDRESLFYFNLQEIPQARPDGEKGNVLTIALRTRIKVFYRPDAIKGEPHKQLGELTWHWDTKARQLVVNNPTPYHYTFKRLEAGEPQRQRIEPGMVAPFSQQRFSLAQGQGQPSHVRFSAINDYGGISDLLNVVVQPLP